MKINEISAKIINNEVDNLTKLVEAQATFLVDLKFSNLEKELLVESFKKILDLQKELSQNHSENIRELLVILERKNESK